MKRYTFCLLSSLLWLGACQPVLEPEPTDILEDRLVLNEVKDVEPVRIGMYSALRSMASPIVIAGDFMADHIQFNGTFTDYRELGTKQITPANGAVGALWGGIYSAIYAANFMLEKLPQVSGVPEATRKSILAEARFIRGFANFMGAVTYGDIPQVTTTDPIANRNIPRTAKATILASVLTDYQEALKDLPELGPTANPTVRGAYATKNTARAAMARYYLYLRNWTQAEQMATEVIRSGAYTLEPAYETIVTKDFTQESILEVGYGLTDDPGTGNFALNNLLVGRREVIPSNQLVLALTSPESGERIRTIGFDATNLRGNDNGWTVRKHGTASEDNNNIVLIRLAEMYLIRAEARAQLGRLTGANGAIADLNVLRSRAKASQFTTGSQADVLAAVERERQYELAFEGHRWYDLVRTGRAQAVMSAFTPNWDQRYELWPIPQTEIQRNPALQGRQNPGY